MTSDNDEHPDVIVSRGFFWSRDSILFLSRAMVQPALISEAGMSIVGREYLARLV